MEEAIKEAFFEGMIFANLVASNLSDKYTQETRSQLAKEAAERIKTLLNKYVYN